MQRVALRIARAALAVVGEIALAMELLLLGPRPLKERMMPSSCGEYAAKMERRVFRLNLVLSGCSANRVG